MTNTIINLTIVFSTLLAAIFFVLEKYQLKESESIRKYISSKWIDLKIDNLKNLYNQALEKYISFFSAIKYKRFVFLADAELSIIIYFFIILFFSLILIIELFVFGFPMGVWKILFISIIITVINFLFYGKIWEAFHKAIEVEDKATGWYTNMCEKNCAYDCLFLVGNPILVFCFVVGASFSQKFYLNIFTPDLPIDITKDLLFLLKNYSLLFYNIVYVFLLFNLYLVYFEKIAHYLKTHVSIRNILGNITFGYSFLFSSVILTFLAFILSSLVFDFSQYYPTAQFFLSNLIFDIASVSVTTILLIYINNKSINITFFLLVLCVAILTLFSISSIYLGLIGSRFEIDFIQASKIFIGNEVFKEEGLNKFLFFVMHSVFIPLLIILITIIIFLLLRFIVKNSRFFLIPNNKNRPYALIRSLFLLLVAIFGVLKFLLI